MFKFKHKIFLTSLISSVAVASAICFTSTSCNNGGNGISWVSIKNKVDKYQATTEYGSYGGQADWSGVTTYNADMRADLFTQYMLHWQDMLYDESVGSMANTAAAIGIMAALSGGNIGIKYNSFSLDDTECKLSITMHTKGEGDNILDFSLAKVDNNKVNLDVAAVDQDGLEAVGYFHYSSTDSSKLKCNYLSFEDSTKTGNLEITTFASADNDDDINEINMGFGYSFGGDELISIMLAATDTPTQYEWTNLLLPDKA